MISLLPMALTHVPAFYPFTEYTFLFLRSLNLLLFLVSLTSTHQLPLPDQGFLEP